MSGGKLFHSRAPATAKARSPRVTHCDWGTSSWCVSEDPQTSSWRHVGQTSQVCSHVWWSRAVQRTKDDRRQLELYSLGRSQSSETGERVGDVVRAPQAGDKSCNSVEYQLETVVQVAWYSTAVVQSRQDDSDDKPLVHRRRHWTSNAAQLTKNGKAAGNGCLNVASHAEVRVEVNSEISDWLWRVNEVGPDSKSWRRQLMTTMSCCTPEQVGLASVHVYGGRLLWLTL